MKFSSWVTSDRLQMVNSSGSEQNLMWLWVFIPPAGLVLYQTPSVPPDTTLDKRFLFRFDCTIASYVFKCSFKSGSLLFTFPPQGISDGWSYFADLNCITWDFCGDYGSPKRLWVKDNISSASLCESILKCYLEILTHLCHYHEITRWRLRETCKWLLDKPPISRCFQPSVGLMFRCPHTFCCMLTSQWDITQRTFLTVFLFPVSSDLTGHTRMEALLRRRQADGLHWVTHLGALPVPGPQLQQGCKTVVKESVLW